MESYCWNMSCVPAAHPGSVDERLSSRPPCPLLVDVVQQQILQAALAESHEVRRRMRLLHEVIGRIVVVVDRAETSH